MTPTEIEQGRMAAIEKILYPACFEIAKQIMERMKDVALVPERVWNSAASLEEVETEWADYINDKCASALSTHFQSLLAEKDAEIERLRKDKDWLWQVNQQKDKRIAELMEVSNTWKPMFLDQARIIRQLEEEINRLYMEIQGYQIDSGYQKGKDNMEAAMMKHLEDFKYPGGNSEFDQELKAKIDEVTADQSSLIQELKAENHRIEWKLKLAQNQHLAWFKSAMERTEHSMEIEKALAEKDELIANLNSGQHPNAATKLSFLDKIEAFSKKHPDIFNDEPTYPCQECGLLRTEAQGGTTFTVCDACWDKHYKKLNSGDPLPDQGAGPK